MKKLFVPLILLILTILLVTRNGEDSSLDQKTEPHSPQPSSKSSAAKSVPASVQNSPASKTRRLASKTFRPQRVPFDSGTLQSFATRENTIEISLAEEKSLSATVTDRKYSPDGELLFIEGTVTEPAPGRFLFEQQPEGSLAGPLWGFIYYPSLETGWGFESGPRGSFLVQKQADALACRKYDPVNKAFEEAAHYPEFDELDITIPAYQNGVIPLESLPGAVAVLYIDFDGEEGPHTGWGDFYAAPHNLNNAERYEIWRRVAEDFVPFRINVTTDLAVFQAAPSDSRQRNIHTTTKTASPNSGGVAYIGSFNTTENSPCWSFNSSIKSAAETISHEFGHTLRLRHDGTFSREYYPGHGDGMTSWGAIMGAAFDPELTQWSKGEYSSADNKENDLSIITGNNRVSYRADDNGATHASATPLTFLSNGDVEHAGIIETTNDIDSFRFTTAGGEIDLTVAPESVGANLDIEASIYDSANSLLTSSNPIGEVSASLTPILQPGTYTIRVTNTGEGEVLGTGYSSYGSLGNYTITGTITDPDLPAFLSIAENEPANTVVGTIATKFDHGSNRLSVSITSGNDGNLFSVDNNGLLTANSSFNFEAFPTNQGQTLTIELFIRIIDNANSALNETVRTIVTIQNLNEPPALESNTYSLLERTSAGRTFATLPSNDPDLGDAITWSILAGNEDNAFQIDADGNLSATTVLTIDEEERRVLTVSATDSQGLNTTADITIVIIPVDDKYELGGVTHTFYRNLSGDGLSVLTSSSNFPNNPTDWEVRDEIDSRNEGDNFGRTVRAFLIPPVTADYTFWLAGDSSCALLTSPDEDPTKATSRAFFNGSTDYQEWDKYLGQKTSKLSLVAGKPYYFELRQKESTGQDHLSLAWQIKSGTTVLTPLEVVPNIYFAPHELNFAPTITSSSHSIRRDAFNDFPIGDLPIEDRNLNDIVTVSSRNPAFYVDEHYKLRLKNRSFLTTAAQTVKIRFDLTDDGSPPLSKIGLVTLTVVGAGVGAADDLNEDPVLNGEGQLIPTGKPTALDILPFTATDTSSDEFVWALLDSNSPFTIDPVTGRLSLTNPDALVPGSNLVTIAVQDSGTQGLYPLHSTSRVFDLFIDDFDSDYLADDWELENFSDLTSRDGSTNEDGDPFPDFMEFALGLDPNEHSTGPIITPSGYQITLPETGTNRFTYITQGSADLNFWEDLATRIGEGDWNLIDSMSVSTETLEDGSEKSTFSHDSPKSFYRLKVLVTEPTEE